MPYTTIQGQEVVYCQQHQILIPCSTSYPLRDEFRRRRAASYQELMVQRHFPTPDVQNEIPMPQISGRLVLMHINNRYKVNFFINLRSIDTYTYNYYVNKVE